MRAVLTTDHLNATDITWASQWDHSPEKGNIYCRFICMLFLHVLISHCGEIRCVQIQGTKVFMSNILEHVFIRVDIDTVTWILLEIYWRTELRIQNPFGQFWENWSEDHLCQFLWRWNETFLLEVEKTNLAVWGWMVNLANLAWLSSVPILMKIGQSFKNN